MLGAGTSGTERLSNLTKIAVSKWQALNSIYLKG